MVMGLSEAEQIVLRQLVNWALDQDGDSIEPDHLWFLADEDNPEIADAMQAARQVMHLAAWKYDHGLECGEEANTAKYLAAEAAFFAADRAVQTHGGLGYAVEY